MRHWLALPVIVATLALAGCGGGEELVVKEHELPVACVAKAKPGNCGRSVPKAYFDYRDNRCKTFSWSGCGGHVPYQSLEECRKQCEPTPAAR
jgi:hypothetical protein